MPDPHNQLEAPAVYAIIPAAGRSRRMGQPKQLLPFGGSTILDSVIDTMLAAPISGLVVVTHRLIADELDLLEDPRIATVINDDEQSQMLDSIRMGITAAEQAFPMDQPHGFLVCPGDMPSVDLASVLTCLKEFEQHPDDLVVASFKQKKGHPVIVPQWAVAELGEIDQGGLAELLRRHVDQLHVIECETPGVIQDIDTPEDYRDVQGDSDSRE